MKSIMLALVLAACGGGSPPPAQPAPPAPVPADAAAAAPVAAGDWFDEALGKMKIFSDQMCACKDMTCAQKVGSDMSDWGQKMEKDHPEPPKLSEAQNKSAADIGAKMNECMGKLTGK
jgi:hypothetical protein